MAYAALKSLFQTSFKKSDDSDLPFRGTHFLRDIGLMEPASDSVNGPQQANVQRRTLSIGITGL